MYKIRRFLVLPLTIPVYCLRTTPRHVTEFVRGHVYWPCSVNSRACANSGYQALLSPPLELPRGCGLGTRLSRGVCVGGGGGGGGGGKCNIYGPRSTMAGAIIHSCPADHLLYSMSLLNLCINYLIH